MSGREAGVPSPQRRRATRRRPLATGRRPQARTTEGWRLLRLPGLCSQRQACGSGRERRTDCASAAENALT